MNLHTSKLSRNKFARIAWFITGCFFVVIGLIGIILPGLPTTVFMLLAAACFYRSSQRFYDWVISNKLFGHHVKNYREGKGMPKNAKVTAIVCMWAFVLFALFVGIPDQFIWTKSGTLLAAVIGTGYITNLPTL